MTEKEFFVWLKKDFTPEFCERVLARAEENKRKYSAMTEQELLAELRLKITSAEKMLEEFELPQTPGGLGWKRGGNGGNTSNPQN